MRVLSLFTQLVKHNAIGVENLVSADGDWLTNISSKMIQTY